MRVIRGLQDLDELAQTLPRSTGVESRSAVTVGVFDGVHLGHLRLLHELLEMASTLGATPTVVTFESHPDELLRGTAPPPIISLPHRLRLLRRAGVERVLVLQFDARVREMDPMEFAQRVLVRGLGTNGLLLGFDSAIGKDRQGTVARFTEIGEELGFAVREGQPFAVDGAPVSSTRIRAAISTGDLDLAHRLLGRWPSAFGAVQHGAARGRTLGFPTANVHPQSLVLPPLGVYAVEALVDGEQFPGVANLGNRPTFEQATAAPILEVHLLDQPKDLDLYGKTLEIAFVAHIRPEQRFPEPDALRAQIAADIKAAGAVFRR